MIYKIQKSIDWHCGQRVNNNLNSKKEFKIGGGYSGDKSGRGGLSLLFWASNMGVRIGSIIGP